MLLVATLKIICTDSTETSFSIQRSAGLNYQLPKFFHFALLIDFFSFFLHLPSKACVFGVLKDCLMSTHNICFR